MTIIGTGTTVVGLALILAGSLTSILLGFLLVMIGALFFALLLRVANVAQQMAQLAQQQAQQHGQQAAPQQVVTPIVVTYPPQTSKAGGKPYAMRMECPSCRSEVLPEHTFCPSCGVRLAQTATW